MHSLTLKALRRSLAAALAPRARQQLSSAASTKCCALLAAVTASARFAVEASSVRLAPAA